MIMNTTNKPLTNIVMFTNLDIVNSTVSSPSAIQFGFLFKSDFEAFKKIVLNDIKFRYYEDDYKYEMYGTASPIYKIYIDNDKNTSDIIQERLEEFYAKYDVRLIYCRL